MTRLVIITISAASLLLWPLSVFSDSPDEYADELWMADMSCNPACVQPQGHFFSGLLSGHTCPIPGHHHAMGTPCPGLFSSGHHRDHGLVQRLGFTPPESAVTRRQRPIPTIPVPVGPPPGNFIAGVFKPQQYQQVPMTAYGFPPGYAHQQGYGYAQNAGQMPGFDAQGQMLPPDHVPQPGQVLPPGHLPPPGQAFPPGYAGYPQEQRIVYVPYAAPPSIYVERPGRIPRPPMLRRMLGDANMYEYPEMPYRLYTTRGPRDFLAPSPPGIGE